MPEKEFIEKYIPKEGEIIEYDGIEYIVRDAGISGSQLLKGESQLAIYEDGEDAAAERLNALDSIPVYNLDPVGEATVVLGGIDPIFNIPLTALLQNGFTKTGRKVEIVTKGEDLLFQLNSKEIIEPAIQELDDFLLKFLKQFGVRSKEFDELKSRLGVDALGATDILNKLIWVTKNRNEETVPEEAGHMIVALMGENNSMIKELLFEIKNWHEYSDIEKTYMPIYNNEKQVKLEAIGKLIAKSLVRNYKASGLDKSLLEKMLDAIEKFIDSMFTNSNLVAAMQYNEKLADHIAINVLSGNTEYIGKLTTNTPKLDYKKALNGNPLAKTIIEFFTGKGAKLTGSIAIAGQGEDIYRSSEEPIHDVDFAVNSVQEFNDLEEELDKLNAVHYHFGWSNKQKDYTTYAYIIPAKGYTIKVYDRDHLRGNGWVTSYDVLDENGNIVKKTSKNHMAVDFFVYKDGLAKSDNSVFKSFSDIFFGKLTLSPIGNAERLFQREKDQEDYRLSKPRRIYQTGGEFKYLQTEEVPASRASAETLNKVKEAARKMGIDIQELADYAKGNPDMDTRGVNGLADLTRGIIALAEGKEGVALTEETVHIATAILEQTNPKLVTEMISKIDRFKIYKETLDKYKNNKNYQLPNGKPDIRKIKKEAVDKLITEVIINKNENIEQYPELREEINQSIVRNWWNTILDWIRGIYRKSNISLFEEAAAQIVAGEIGTVADITEGGVMFQLSDNQKTIQEKILATQDEIEKVVEDETKVEPVLLDSEEARNYYRRKKPDGTFETIKKRVTDRVKAWYKRKFGDKQFTPEEKKFNELKRDLGIQGHKDLEEIHGRYFHKDGTRRASPGPRPTKFSNLSEEMYDKLETYFTDLLKTLDPKTIVLSEVIVYDKKNKEAGTIDFLAIEPSGKAHILDWKFMHIKGDDVAWFKQGAFNIQLGTYKKMLRENYGIKEFGMTRAIPIAMEFKLKNPRDPKSGSYLGGIAIGSVDVSKIEDLRLVPISEETESTGFEALDEILRKMNGLLAQIGKEKVGDEEEREFKIERLNTLRKAIRLAQTTMNIAPLIDVIEVMRKEGDRILDDYNAIYKNRPARSSDSKNAELSDFADDMNNYIKLSDIFVNIGRKIGTLVYTPQMEAEVTTEEEKADVAQRKEVLRKLREESDAIYDSREAIKKATLDFADKHIGERNLVFGLLKAEKVLKGLASMFRGAADISLRSVEILTKLVNNAQSLATKDALSEVEQLMSIREKLAKRGGDLRKLVQQVYQKDDKGKIVNKLIYKYKKEFFSEVDKKAEDGGDKNWILQNIDVEAYKKEAEEKLKDQIKKIQGNRYAGTPEEEKATKERLIEEAKRKWDIDRIDFDGWKNHIIKRHPLAKWYSEEYKNLQKDPELMELYNFIVKFNKKAEDTGYISNQMSKIFLPFVRKSMAEELVWDNRLSVMDNFYKSIQLNPDDTGYGEFNEITGALENSIPKYYTKDFTFKDGVNDYSDVSEDLFKNLILYIQQVNKYKYLTDVEGQLKLVKTIEEFKSHLNTDRLGNVVYENGKPKEIEGNERNTKIYDDFLRVMLYDQKYVIDDSDLPFNIGKVLNFVKDGVNKVAGREVWKKDEDPKPSSLIKTIDAANRAFQLKTLGFDFISGAVNMFGGNIQLSTQAGNYFKAREFAKNEAKLTFQRFDSNEDKEMFVQLINTFMPLKDDPSYKMYKQAGMSKLTQGNLSDTLMFFMRQPEILIEKSVFLTLLQNSMVVNGQIVNIREHVRNKYKGRYDSAASYNAVKDDIENEINELKRTKSIDKTKKLVDGKLEIPGLNLNNIEELQRLTNLSRRIAANATGSMTKENINRMSMSVWTKSMMVFKNWIPKLIDTRFGEFRKVVDDFSVRVTDDGFIEGQKYDIGRIRLLTHVLGDGIITGAANLKNILYLNDAGLERLDQMFEEFREKYERETGETLNISREDFIDLIRTNLRNQVKELAILVSLMGVLLSLGFVAPDDDEDKATKNFHRYSQKVFSKFADELLFFYTPSGISGTLSGGVFPALGLAEDIGRFTKHFAMETTGMDLDPQTSIEDVRKKAQPIKNLMKVAPVTKSLVTYLAIFNEDFAKEFDVTIQKENRR
jgi:hypothetical protein